MSSALFDAFRHLHQGFIDCRLTEAALVVELGSSTIATRVAALDVDFGEVAARTIRQVVDQIHFTLLA